MTNHDVRPASDERPPTDTWQVSLSSTDGCSLDADALLEQLDDDVVSHLTHHHGAPHTWAHDDLGALAHSSRELRTAAGTAAAEIFDAATHVDCGCSNAAFDTLRRDFDEFYATSYAAHRHAIWVVYLGESDSPERVFTRVTFDDLVGLFSNLDGLCGLAWDLDETGAGRALFDDGTCTRQARIVVITDRKAVEVFSCWQNNDGVFDQFGRGQEVARMRPGAVSLCHELQECRFVTCMADDIDDSSSGPAGEDGERWDETFDELGYEDAIAWLGDILALPDVQLDAMASLVHEWPGDLDELAATVAAAQAPTRSRA